MSFATQLRRLSALSALLLTCMLTFPLQSIAVPITYTMTIAGASGTLGTLTFSNATLVLTLEGDTSTVTSFNITGPPGTIGASAAGFENLTGVASVQVLDTNTGAILGQGTFASTEQMFVSVDDTNGGLGFGSGGVPFGMAGFPGQVAYPYAMCISSQCTFTTPSVIPTPFSAYDLKSDFVLGPNGTEIPGWTVVIWDLSCVNFPDVGLNPLSPCGAPKQLSTTAGFLQVNTHGRTAADGSLNITTGMATFTAKTHSATPFADFRANAELNAHRGGFNLNGSFTLGAASNGINPLSEAVTLQLSTYSVSIPPGSFTLGQDSQFDYQGVIDGVTLQIQIEKLGGNHYRIHARTRGTNLPASVGSLPLALTIGDDSGSTITSTSHDD